MAMFSFGGGGAQPEIQWLWMDDGNRWEYYDFSDGDQIEQAYLTGAAGASVVSAVGGRAGTGATYCINFGTMKQVNIATNFTRAVKRNLARTDSALSERWEWSVGATWVQVPLWVCAQMVVSRDLRREPFTTAHLDDGAKKRYTFTVTRIAQLGLHWTTAMGAASAAAAAGGGGGSGGRLRPSQAVLSAQSVQQASQSSQSASGSREREFKRLVDAAKNCTATVAADETCAVCLDGFSANEPALLLSKCQGHYMHRECILRTFRAMGPKCPTCSTMYAALIGTQPDGTMTFSTRAPGAKPLSGYETVGTIVINYNFLGGIQSRHHPNPGQAYRGTSRVAYLPNTPEGREVLGLLCACFEQKMTFTVGTSVTTGISNSVIWNGIHHKTATSGGSANFGYPDRHYFTSIGFLFIVLVGADRAGQGTWRAVLWRSPLAIDGNPSTPSTPR
eukprot:jgi/Undpi1/10886/HiC_scaffold_3.g01412.m1